MDEIMSDCCCQINCLCLPISSLVNPNKSNEIIGAKNEVVHQDNSGVVIPLSSLQMDVVKFRTGLPVGISQLPKLPSYPPTILRYQEWDHPGRVGLHVGLQGTLMETVQQAQVVGSRCCQVYLGNYRTYNVRNLSSQDRLATQQYLLANQSNLYIHAPLVVQLGGKIGEDGLTKSMEVLIKEIEAVHDLPASIVVHMGKGKYGCTIEQMGQIVNHLGLTKGYYSSNPYRLLLENDAGQGSSIVKSVDDFRKLYEVVDRSVVGLCLDTQHCFAGGHVQWSEQDTIPYLEAVASAVGSDQIGLIHLNDSKTTFGSHHDAHANLGQGHIWSRDNTGFRWLMDWINQTNTDAILETGNGYAEATHINGLLRQ